jgi:quercetin dioxygenase-like cupin family protein
MNIDRPGARPSRRGSPDWFTGTVWVDELLPAAEPARLHVLRVFFEPGARTAWHSHPLGQVLHILTGTGRVQRQGEAPAEVHPGDTVWFAPGERHWHGAAPGHTMVHLAIQQTTADGNEVTWQEHVAPADYNGKP